MQLLIGNYANLYDISLGVTPIFQLLELKPELQSPLVDVASRLPSLPEDGQDSRAQVNYQVTGKMPVPQKIKLASRLSIYLFAIPVAIKARLKIST